MRISIIIFLFIFSLNANSQSYSDSISVNLFLLDQCRISQNMTAEINELYDMYHSDSIHFKAYFPNHSSKPRAIDTFMHEYHLKMDYQTDYDKERALHLGAMVAPEVVVYDEVHRHILYSGRIDNSFEKIGQRRRNISSKDLRNALKKIKNQETIEVKKTQAVGCAINFRESEF